MATNNGINLTAAGIPTYDGAGNFAASTTTNHAILIGSAANELHALGVATNGQLPIGSAGADPVLANLTSSGGTITITNGAGTINLDVAAGTGVVETLTGNSGGAIAPVAGNINTLGTGSITIAGAGNTLTTELTGLTNHAVLVGAGTATISNVGPTATALQVLQSAGSSADPAFSTATYPSTTTINQILYSSANDVVAGLATGNSGVLTTGATGVPVITALAANGQLIIGSGAGAPAAATITAGTNISIVNGANSITISADTVAQSVHYTNVNTSPYVVAVDDYYLSVDSSGGAIILQFPDAPTANRIWVVKDRTGSAAVDNITITTVSGAVTFDGVTSFVMNTNYESVNLLANATPTYEVY